MRCLCLLNKQCWRLASRRSIRGAVLGWVLWPAGLSGDDPGLHVLGAPVCLHLKQPAVSRFPSNGTSALGADRRVGRCSDRQPRPQHVGRRAQHTLQMHVKKNKPFHYTEPPPPHSKTRGSVGNDNPSHLPSLNPAVHTIPYCNLFPNTRSLPFPSRLNTAADNHFCNLQYILTLMQVCALKLFLCLNFS